MKILLVHNRYQIPGGEEVVFEQERELLERAGHKVVTYCRSNFEAESYGGLKRLVLVKNMAWSGETKETLGRVLRDETPDVVHVHNTFMMMSPAVFEACREAGVPVVQTLHNYRMFCPAANFVRDGKPCEECAEQSLWSGVMHGCYRDSRAATASVAWMLTTQRKREAWADLYIALSEFSRQKFISHGVPAEKICVKPNFVANDPGERTGEGQRAVAIGRLSEEKGLETLLRAWKQLPSSVPLSIVGDGPLSSDLQKMTGDLGLANVTFHGRLSRMDTLAILKTAKFLVVPSQCYENFPMGIVEAFACGVPVICSRLGAMQELVSDHHTGLHFNAGDATSLASKVAWAWAHNDEMQTMGKQARREYEAKYTAEKNYPQLMEIYGRVARSVPASVAVPEGEMALSASRL